ncbi:DUF29 domain-containing protein [uncultured Thiohalocapsa sp.]|uniref:DUF29 domain-containing protein n=1 Tax=uncultured Thiohalocapsa sp. TaxID=768990 RepID=UPI0025EC8412|nr:DUF29 domain-containing protein [uncultured Thiohalocapsa sp.]
MSISADYDQDFFAWITHNVQLLRSGRLSEVDAEHVAEELESMGKRDLRQLRSRLQVLILADSTAWAQAAGAGGDGRFQHRERLHEDRPPHLHLPDGRPRSLSGADRWTQAFG